MAKFREGNLDLKDNQKVRLGDSQNAELYWDGSEAIFTSTISGVDPTQSYHISTKGYTDTISGTLSSEIDSDISTHAASGDHDGRYYIESEVDTISGSLSDEIDGDITTHESGSSHDGRYYTEAEVDTISGSLSDEIDSDIATFSGTIDVAILFELDENDDIQPKI